MKHHSGYKAQATGQDRANNHETVRVCLFIPNQRTAFNTINLHNSMVLISSIMINLLTFVDTTPIVWQRTYLGNILFRLVAKADCTPLETWWSKIKCKILTHHMCASASHHHIFGIELHTLNGSSMIAGYTAYFSSCFCVPTMYLAISRP